MQDISHAKTLRECTSLTAELVAFLLCLLQLGLQGGAVVLRLTQLGLDLLQRLLQSLLSLHVP